MANGGGVNKPKFFEFYSKNFGKSHKNSNMNTSICFQIGTAAGFFDVSSRKLKKNSLSFRPYFAIHKKWKELNPKMIGQVGDRCDWDTRLDLFVVIISRFQRA